MTEERLFKVISDTGKSCHGGTGQWSLPVDGTPGAWMPPIDRIELCERGYHLCREQDLTQWLGPTIYEAEARGERLTAADKIVVAEARLLRRLPWDERSARMFACDCAEHVLLQVGDARAVCAETIAVARRYAVGDATDDELAAAWAAVRDSARAAVRDSARAAARDSARDAVLAATWTAALAAALAAVRAAARDSARAAARDSARDAVLAATWTAALAAVRAAARDAERQWQTALLMRYLYPI